MTTLRTDIEKALDEIISNEEGMKFQGLAVVLAKQKCPELIASERKKDLGLDAYVPSSLAQDRIGKGLACSLTTTISKVKEDIERFQPHTTDVKVLLFATPQKVTRYTEETWANIVKEEYDIDLKIISREDIITDLMIPSNASICRSHLGIPLTVEPTITELFEKAQEAALEVITTWLTHSRLDGKPRISLQAVKLDQHGRETEEVLDLASLHASLLESRRIILEAPAGRGKTTTLIQLAEFHRDQGELFYLINLPEWATSTNDVLEFIARMPQFRSRGINSEKLARLFEEMPCSFLLNGWNEVSDTNSEFAVQALTNLERNYPKSGIIVTTRTHYIPPALPGSFRTKLLTLNRFQRMEYLQQALASSADQLAEQLDGDRVLDDLTRTPLILAEVTTIFQSGKPIPKTKFGILGAVMQLLEQVDKHRVYLTQYPLLGHSQDYLKELAAQMIKRGEVTIVEAQANSIVLTVSRRLNVDGQIAKIPEPTAILSALCSHHILERMEYPAVGFRFEHQQFQEFYAALELKRQLWDLVKEDKPDRNLFFAREYLNIPLWEEPLKMIAEHIGEQSTELSDPVNAVTVGNRLIKLALNIDPVFASDLARLCGKLVWNEIRDAVIERLRSWHQVIDVSHQRCALAGMIASGSDEFIDILLPLLTNEKEQIRLETYRAWVDFHASSLGRNWCDLVKSWREELRKEFIGEVLGKKPMIDILEEFALTDTSPVVRFAAFHELQWVGATDAANRVLDKYDEDDLAYILRKNKLDSVSLEVQPRILATYKRLLGEFEDPLKRLRIRLKILHVGGDNDFEGIKEELTRLPAEKISVGYHELIQSALNLLQKADPCWVSQFVVKHIIDGSLSGNHWAAFISSIPKDIKQELFGKISQKTLDRTSIPGIIAVLKATADTDVSENLFSRLCMLKTDIPKVSTVNDANNLAIIRQLEELFRSMPQNIAISGMLRSLSPEFNPVEYYVVVDLLNRFGIESPDLRNQIPDDLRQNLRKYLKKGVSFILSQDDFNGQLKMYLSTALAKIGDPEDIADLQQLIQADIERVKRGMKERLRGKRGPLANGVTTKCSNWHVRAVMLLDSQRAEEILLEVLCEPEYEEEAAKALVKLARNQPQEKWAIISTLDYSDVWEARSGRHRLKSFDEERRLLYKNAIKQHISTIMEQRSQSDVPDNFNFRLKKLACTVAQLDSYDSAEFVMEIIAFPGEWDIWTRTEALEILLFSGARLDAVAVLSALNPAIEYTCKHIYHDPQAINILRKCLCLLPFVDPPSTGIDRIREILDDIQFPRYELRELVIALGYSRCNTALDLLLEIATLGGNEFFSFDGKWFDAIYALDPMDSKRILLSFVDPEIKNIEVKEQLDYDDRGYLSSCIVNIARNDLKIRDRLYELCENHLSPAKRQLLSDVISRLGTPEAFIAGLALIQDDSELPIPDALEIGLEQFIYKHLPYGNTGQVYTLEPQSANEIRSRLFNMLLFDDRRRRSAGALLGKIESWRLELGRPNNEPRHPAIDSGEPWPPISSLVNIFLSNQNTITSK